MHNTCSLRKEVVMAPEQAAIAFLDLETGFLPPPLLAGAAMPLLKSPWEVPPGIAAADLSSLLVAALLSAR